MPDRKTTSERILRAAFTVLIALLVGIGYLGLSRMNQINANLNDVVGRQWTTLRLARQAVAYSNQNSRIMMEVFFLEDKQEIDRLLADRTENSRKISDLLIQIQRECDSREDQQALAAVEDARAVYVASYQQALHLLVDEHQPDAARAMMVGQTTPALFKYHAAWEAFMQLQIDQVDQAAQVSKSRYAAARVLVLLLIGLAVLVAISIAVFATRNMTQEIRTRGRAEREVRDLNATLEGRVEQRTRELAQSNQLLTSEVAVRRLAQDRMRLQAAALEAAANAIVITDSKGAITWANRAFTVMTGYGKEEVLGKNPRFLKSGKQPKSYYENLWSTVSSGKVWQGEIINRRKDGTTYIEEMTITPVVQGAGDATETHFIAIKLDVTERRRAQDAILESEKRYRSLFENMLEGFAYCEMIFDDLGRPVDFKYLAVNSTFERLTGLENVVGRRFTEIIPQIKGPEPELFERYGRVVLTGKPERFEIKIKGLGMWFSISAYEAEKGCFVTVFDNITERKRAEESLLFKTALLEAQAETTIDGILVVDESSHIVLANKQFGLHFEIPDEMLSTQDDQIVLEHVMSKLDSPDTFVERVRYLYGHRDEKSRDEFRLKNGKVFDRYSAPLVDSTAQYRGRIWYFRDITDRKLAEERVQFLAYYDALTGLPNRTLLQDRLAKALAGARRRKDKVALLFLDLDRFKTINDSLGHSVGDLLLRDVAERLKKWARDQDTVARVGGDEFLIVLNGVRDVADAAVAAERLMDAMAAEFVIQGRSLGITCSLGISVFPEHGTDSESLVKNADAAMYCAKESGRNTVRYFTEDMNAQALERLTLENSLRRVLDRNELFLVYQPQLEIASRRIIGLEALLRWQHPELGLVPPDKFIRIAENSGLITSIGEWVLRTACTQSRKWQDAGLLAVPIAVNVSAVQFRQEDFCQLIREVLRETGLAAQYLELELTESLLLSNADVTMSVIQELKAMGVQLSIDDFGTGYSSFGYLRQFRVNKLKVDRSFIRDVAVDPDDAAITTAIISLAKSLNLKVIAEGVETEAQVAFLSQHQCDEIQGYYFSKPLSVDDVAGLLREAAGQQAKSQSAG